MPRLGQYRTLQADKIVQTVARLERRIQERFPDAGLVRVATELHEIARESLVRSLQIRQPNIGLRLLIGVLITLLVVVLGMLISQLHFDREHLRALFDPENFVQVFEAGLGSLVFMGAAILFLASLELRWKRQRALEAIRELRALAHIVDMHQLTKDPESTLRGGPATPSSPRRTLSPFMLNRYLDYCTELLSLVTKIGAIYVQDFPDPVALESVDQLADLTSGLSRSIWQKMIILDRVVGDIGEQSWLSGNPNVLLSPTVPPQNNGETAAASG